MSKKIKIGILGLLVVAALAALLTTTALAQEGEEAPAPMSKVFGWHGRGGAFGFDRDIHGQEGLEAAAGALNMTADELSTQLWGGNTLADLAEEANVDLQDVRDAVDAALETAFEAANRDAIEQAVEDGNLTGGHADWLLEGLDNGYWGRRGFDAFGCGGRRSFRSSGRFGGF